MSTKVINTLLIIFFIILVGVSFIIYFLDWGWVDVQTYEGPKSIHFAIPVPLNVVNWAMHLSPQQEWRKEIPQEVLKNKDAIIKALQELKDCENATLIKVDTPKEKVLIEKRGDSIYLDVDAEDAHVKVTIPIRFFIKTLEESL